jgi:hypothetical protein
VGRSDNLFYWIDDNLSSADPPAVKELLGPDETVINPHYMRQLLQYGIRLGLSQSSDPDSEQLLRDAEVREMICLPVRNLKFVFQRLVAELKQLEP